jgi:hypothetical protein
LQAGMLVTSAVTIVVTPKEDVIKQIDKKD